MGFLKRAVSAVVNGAAIISIILMIVGFLMALLAAGSLKLMIEYMDGNPLAILIVGVLGAAWISLTGISLASLALPEPAISKIAGAVFGTGAITTGIALLVMSFFLAVAVGVVLLAVSLAISVLALAGWRRVKIPVALFMGIANLIAGIAMLLNRSEFTGTEGTILQAMAVIWATTGIIYLAVPMIKLVSSRRKAAKTGQVG